MPFGQKARALRRRSLARLTKARRFSSSASPSQTSSRIFSNKIISPFHYPFYWIRQIIYEDRYDRITFSSDDSFEWQRECFTTDPPFYTSSNYFGIFNTTFIFYFNLVKEINSLVYICVVFFSLFLKQSKFLIFKKRKNLQIIVVPQYLVTPQLLKLYYNYIKFL